MGGTVSMIARAALPLLLAVGILAFATHGAVPASAQEPTPTDVPLASASDDGFFSDFSVGDVLSILTLAAVAALALGLFRVQNARIALAEKRAERSEADLDGQKERCNEELEKERRHSERMREQNAAAIQALEQQVELAKHQAGVAPSGVLRDDAAELPEEVRQNLSNILSLLSEMKASRQQVEVFEPLSPEGIAEEHLREGNAFYTAGDYDKALAEYERGLELQPENATLLMNRGAVLSNLGRQKEALEAYDKALALRPDHAGTLNNQGTALGNLGRYEEALTALDQALVLRPDHADTLMNRGTTLAYLGRYDEALQSYDQSLTVRPDHADTLMARGTTLRILGRNQEALQAYDKALALRPDHADTLMNRGVALHSLSRYEEALQSYDEAFALRPDHAGTFYNRACMYSLWGKPEEALQDLRHAIEGDPENRQEARKDSDFDNIRKDPRFQALVREPESDNEDESEPASDD